LLRLHPLAKAGLHQKVILIGLDKFCTVKTIAKSKGGICMAIKERLINDERDDLTKDVDDLDAAYILKMKEAGIDEDLLEQFADFLKTDGAHEE
jgi:hypothetical protein